LRIILQFLEKGRVLQMKTWKQSVFFGNPQPSRIAAKVPLLMVAIIALSFGFVACDDGNGNTHTHDWGSWSVTTPATCTNAGVEKRVCSLDATHVETKPIAVNPNTHVWGNLIEGTAPTCTTAGSGTRTCTLNGEHTEPETINALGHDWNGWEISTISISKKACSRCTEKINGEIGDTGPGGGKIFYVLPTGFNMTDDNSIAYYLEAAPADMPTFLEFASSIFVENWSDPIASLFVEGTSREIGSGRKNTTLILTKDANAPAAKACNEYNNNGKTDWFLPSDYELQRLYLNKTNIGTLWNDNVDDLEEAFYWSSSQNNEYYPQAYCRSFIDSRFFARSKNLEFSVRAIRAF
jgi:hypothetical protein